MKSFVGIGTGKGTNAISQATNGIGHPSGIIFICNYEELKGVTEALSNMYPNIPIIGASGSSIANGSPSDTQLVITAFYEDAKLSFGVLEGISNYPIVQVKKLEESMNAVGASKENTVCYEFCTGAEEKLVVTMQSVMSKKGIPLVGGTIFGVPAGKTAQVAYNGKLYEDACAFAFIRNTAGKVKVYKENIYQKKPGSVGHYATKVVPAERGVLDLDGRRASDVYCQEVGVSKNQIVDNVFQNPIGRAVGNEVYITSMREVDQNGGIYFFKRIYRNDYLYFLELSDYEKTEKETRENIRRDVHKVSLILGVDCAYRYILYGNKNYLKTYASDMATLGNHVSLIGGGEQYMNQHVNQTMVCAVFE